MTEPDPGRASSRRRASTGPRRRSRVWTFLLVAFVVVPIVEIYVLIQVGQVIGGWWTVLLLIIDSAVGAWLVRREGSRAWASLRTALNSGRMPAKEIADGILILVGGTLMLTPGFVTDLIGIVLILPLTRPVTRRLLTAVVARRLVAAPFATGFAARGFGGPSSAERRTDPSEDGPVVRGEVVDDDPE